MRQQVSGLRAGRALAKGVWCAGARWGAASALLRLLQTMFQQQTKEGKLLCSWVGSRPSPPTQHDRLAHTFASPCAPAGTLPDMCLAWGCGTSQGVLAVGVGQHVVLAPVQPDTSDKLVVNLQAPTGGW